MFLAGNRLKSLRCAICRETTALSEIAYVDAQAEEPEGGGESVQVKGSHSTKVQAVVQRLLMIKKEDPQAKCLVFSTVIDLVFFRFFF